MKFGTIVPQVSRHRLTESEFLRDVILSRWQLWRHFMQKCAAPAEWTRSYCRAPMQQCVSSWCLVHSCLFVSNGKPVRIDKVNLNDSVSKWVRPYTFMKIYFPKIYLIDCVSWEQESWAIAKMTARYALCMGALKIFGSPWVHPRLLFPKFLMGF